MDRTAPGPRISGSRGWRKPHLDKVYLRIWNGPHADPLVRRGSEAELIPEFHRLRGAGAVFMIELGSLESSKGRDRAFVAWLSWKNPGVAPTCPHCGGNL